MSRVRTNLGFVLPGLAILGVVILAASQFVPAQPPKVDPPLLPPLADPKAPDLATLMAKMKAAKPDIAKKHNDLLAARYDLADRAGEGKMTRGKALQAGPRAKLPEGTTWEAIAAMTPE